MTVLVIGNCTLDRIFHVARFPRPGETVLATRRLVDAGGKGANQAVAAARAGAAVRLVGAVGADAEGDLLRRRLAVEGIAADDLVAAPGPTDVSVITVAPGGENCIVSAHSAAAAITPAVLEPVLAALGAGDILLLQGNLAEPVARHCLGRARAGGARTVVNPAPIRYPYDTLWPLIDIAVLNEVELEDLGGPGGPEAAGRAILGAGAGLVVATLGAEGAALISAGETVRLAAPPVTAVDATGAGDVFCGVFTAALAGPERDPVEAARLAIQAASLSVTRPGTQASFPTAEEIAALRRG